MNLSWPLSSQILVVLLPKHLYNLVVQSCFNKTHEIKSFREHQIEPDLESRYVCLRLKKKKDSVS